MIGVTFDSQTTSLVSKKIDHAEDEVRKYLAKRYDLSSATFQTATSTPPLVRSLTERLAEGYSWQAISRGSKESLTRAKEMIDPVMKELEAIAAYEVELVDTLGSLIPDMSNTSYRVLSNTTDYTPTFNEDDELCWRVDSDKLDDIADSRDS